MEAIGLLFFISLLLLGRLKAPSTSPNPSYSTEKRSLPGCLMERVLDSGSRVFSCPNPLEKTYLPATRALISFTVLVITKYLIRSDAARKVRVKGCSLSWQEKLGSRMWSCRSHFLCSKEAKKGVSWCPAYSFLLFSLC